MLAPRRRFIYAQVNSRSSYKAETRGQVPCFVVYEEKVGGDRGRNRGENSVPVPLFHPRWGKCLEKDIPNGK